MSGVGRRELGSGRVERFAAWVVTGPPGFFVAGVIDWALLVAHVIRSRLGRREPW